MSGLALFLAGHVLYIRAFTLCVRLVQRKLPFVLYGVAAAAQSAVWALHVKDTPASQHRPYAYWAGVGGLSFLVSDTVLSIDRFLVSCHSVTALLLGTYWWAQWCFANSLRGQRH